MGALPAADAQSSAASKHRMLARMPASGARTSCAVPNTHRHAPEWEKSALRSRSRLPGALLCSISARRITHSSCTLQLAPRLRDAFAAGGCGSGGRDDMWPRSDSAVCVAALS